jgi:hypothetical protein
MGDKALLSHYWDTHEHSSQLEAGLAQNLCLECSIPGREILLGPDDQGNDPHSSHPKA